MAVKVALIHGIESRRGASLARYLVEELQYDVHAFVNWQDVDMVRQRIDRIGPFKISLHTPKMEDSVELAEMMREVCPDVVYSLHHSTPANSDPATSHRHDPLADAVEGVTTLRLMEALRSAGLTLSTRFFQEQRVSCVDALTLPCRFDSPHACSKLFSHWTVRHYREVHGMFAANGAFFEKVLACDDTANCHSFADDICRRLAAQFVELSNGKRDCVRLELHDNETVGSNGDIDVLLDAHHEWAHVDDLVKSMCLALSNHATNNDEAGASTSSSSSDEDNNNKLDFVFSTRQFYSLRDFCSEALNQVVAANANIASQLLMAPPPNDDHVTQSFHWRKVNRQHAVCTVEGTALPVIQIRFSSDDKWSLHSSDAASSSSWSASLDDEEDKQRTDEKIEKTRKVLEWQPTKSFRDIVGDYLSQAGGIATTANDREVSALAAGANLLLLEE